jgi:hypothetical protein
MLILTSGKFGAAVGARLVATHGVTTAELWTARADLDSLVRNTDFIGVAIWRPEIEACREIDTLCHYRGIRWSLAELHGSVLSCGPLVIPGHGACYHCYRQRELSHHKSLERERVLLAAYENDPL